VACCCWCCWYAVSEVPLLSLLSVLLAACSRTPHGRPPSNTSTSAPVCSIPISRSVSESVSAVLVLYPAQTAAAVAVAGLQHLHPSSHLSRLSVCLLRGYVPSVCVLLFVRYCVFQVVEKQAGLKTSTWPAGECAGVPCSVVRQLDARAVWRAAPGRAFDRSM